MQAPTYLVEVRDRTFTRIGQIAPEYLDLMFTEVHRGVGQWTLKLPNEHPLLPTLKTEGAGIIITKRWVDDASVVHTRVYSGRMKDAVLSQNAEDPKGTWKISGWDDGIVAQATQVLPDPANPANAQTAGYWVAAGKAETVMKNAVKLNAGSTAIASRKYTWLTTATDLARGLDVKASARFDVLGDLLASLGTVGGLGWRFYQSGSGITFDVYPVTDKSATIRLDVRNGGLESTELGLSAPGATAVYVLGQGEGAARKVRIVTSTASDADAALWGLRWEVSKDQRNTNDDTELDQAGTEILTEQGTTVKHLKVTPSDSPGMALGIDWDLGDTITVSINGVPAKAIVTQVATAIGKAGVIQQATIGDPTGYDWDAKVGAKIANHEQRVSDLESRVGTVNATVLADTGDIKITARATAPTGWLLADGAAVSRTTYAGLFSAIGTTYGVGDGSTTFNLPNLKGRVPVGRDAGQTEFDTLGEIGGTKTHTLTTAEIPAHDHQEQFASNAIAAGGGSSVGGLTAAGGVGLSGAQQATAATGGGGAHNNLQPYVVLNYIIKT